MLRTENQTYLCKPGETVQVDSKTDGGAISFFLDKVPQAGSSFTFDMPDPAPADRQLGAVFIGAKGNRAAVVLKVVSNRPNSQDLTVLSIGSDSNHATTFWDFSTAVTSDLLDFFDGTIAPVTPKPAKKKRAKKQARSSI